jgi:hypothetical protein
MLRINLLRHLPAPEAPVEKTPRRGAGKRLVGLLVAVALIAGAVWFFRSPYFKGFAWKSAPVATEPVPVAVDSAPPAPKALEGLEARAVEEIAALQASALRLSIALESFLPGAAATPRVSRAVLSPPAEFLLRGEAASPEALSRLQESLVLAPGLDLARSASQDNPAGPGLEFLFAGTVSADSANSTTSDATLDSTNSIDSLDSMGSAIVVPLLDAAALDRAWAAFLEDAAAAGIAFTVLPAGAPTTAGSLQAHAYRVQAPCAPPLLREFLASRGMRGSPFGIRRITWEINSGSPLVSLDIMAFSRR